MSKIGNYKFKGKWISDGDFAELKPKNNFSDAYEINETFDEKRNNHILFRKRFSLADKPLNAFLYITADDYYKVYVNGSFVGQGPAPAYYNNYNYNVYDVSKFLSVGINVIAVHTYYQGLVNRVWQSGDDRQGLLCDLVVDEKVVVKSDESFLTHKHTAFSFMGISGFYTQFLEQYDSNAKEIRFYNVDFDESDWVSAKERKYVDYRLCLQRMKPLEFSKVSPVIVKRDNGVVFVDFGKCYVGSLSAKAKGQKGQKIKIFCGQELNEDNTVRHEMRCKCDYSEEWILSGDKDELVQFDYKAFRYAEFHLEDNVEIDEICLDERHYPFVLNAKMNPLFVNDEKFAKIWELCVNSQKYGVQETIQDCIDREKGFYLGDGCYTALANYILTGNDDKIRQLIDMAFCSSFLSEGLVSCLCCSFVQKIAEFPLILISLILWHYRLSGDKEYLRLNFSKARSVIDFYRDNYEENGVLQNLDRWCVVEWPRNFRDGYSVDVSEGQVCEEAHVAINAYYLNAVITLNKIAEILDENPYREVKSMQRRFVDLFYDKELHLFKDGVNHNHVSLIGNIFPYAFGLIDDEAFEKSFYSILETKMNNSISLFGFFPLLYGFVKKGEMDKLKEFIRNKNFWLNMIDEGATTTFEAWGKNLKWNTSLFHLTFSSVVVFMADIDLNQLFT